MSDLQTNARRLRQAVLGCTIHLHGPVQAFAEILSSVHAGEFSMEELKLKSIELSQDRVEELLDEGVQPTDPRIIKEQLTQQFVTYLLRELETRTPVNGDSL